MSTKQMIEEAQAIADLFNNQKDWKIDTISPFFVKHASAKPEQIQRLFKSEQARAFVTAAWLAVRVPEMATKAISISALSRVIDADKTRLYTLVKLQKTSEAQVKHLNALAKQYPAIEKSQDARILAAVKLLKSLDLNTISDESAEALMSLRPKAKAQPKVELVPVSN